mmetsp:Transcript_24745/g.76431  ORF Transcript_24745/g.76431 Transcript_24745/m.76431 type:complete len:101 (-) Transcript_24745:44-346(-)
MTPDYAWATTREHPYLAKINVHTKKVETIDMSHVGCTALVSSRNHYLYYNCRVCCSCGVDGDTGAACSFLAANVTCTGETVVQRGVTATSIRRYDEKTQY